MVDVILDTAGPITDAQMTGGYSVKCTEYVAVAVVVSFLLGAVTGIFVVLIAYIHRTRQFCFKTKDQAESSVNEDAEVDMKFSAERALSKTSGESVNGTDIEPAISESLTDVCQYETLSSDAKQSETYDALKHETIAKGHQKVAERTSVDSNLHAGNLNENLQDSNVNDTYFILEKDNVWNNHFSRKRRPSTTYETIEIGNSSDGYPVSVTWVEPRIGFAQDVPFSGDQSADECGSHEYIILEAIQDTNCTDGTIDVSTRRKTDSPISVMKVQSTSLSAHENSLSGGKFNNECRSHEYVILEAAEGAKCTENTMDLCTPRQTKSPISTTRVESLNGFPHEISFSCDKSVDECRSHEYFILETTEDSYCKRKTLDPYILREIDDGPRTGGYPMDFPNEADSAESRI